MKTAGSVAVFGFIRLGSADPHPDPDLRQNVLDPHTGCFCIVFFLFSMFSNFFSVGWRPLCGVNAGDKYSSRSVVTCQSILVFNLSYF
jgi:hypothetical protein